MDEESFINQSKCRNCKSYESGVCREGDEKVDMDYHCATFTLKEIPDALTDNDIRNDIIGLIKDDKTTLACFRIASYLLNKYYMITLSDTKEIYLYIGGVYLPVGEEKLSKDIQNILQDYCKLHMVNEIFGHIRRSTVTNRENINEPLDKICLQNGILNLKDLTITEHTPEIFFLNKLPVSYDPTAKCPAIQKFLGEVVNKDHISLLQEFAGYCLYKEYFIHKAFMLIGIGRNGKTTFLKLLRAFLGPSNTTSVHLQSIEKNRFAVSSLYGKLANICPDLSPEALSGTAMFKSLTGQDPIAAEKKFKDQFFYENYGKLIFAANQIPKSSEDTDAFFARWIIIYFPNQFIQNADKQLIKKLTTPEELSGFLNLAIEGLRRLLQQQDFSDSKSIQEVREQYIRMSDSVGAFVMDCVEIKPDKWLRKKVIYLTYCDYCRDKGYPISPENTFHKNLQAAIRIEDHRPSLEVDGKKERVQCWRGIDFSEMGLNYGNNPDKPDNTDVSVNHVKDVRDKSLIKFQNGGDDLNTSYDN